MFRQAQLVEARTKAEKTRIEAQLYQANPSLLRLRELETLSALAGNSEARIYFGFDKHTELTRD